MNSSSRRIYRRRGTALVEVMIYIALASVVLGTIGVMLNGMWRVQRSMSDYRVAANAIGQLAEQLRADVHSAAEARIVEGSSAGLIRITLAEDNLPPSPLCLPPSRLGAIRIDLAEDKHVEYRSDKLGVERTVTQANAVVQRESYFLPAGSSVEWSIAPFEQGKLLTALLEYPLNNLGKGEPADCREFKIEVAIPDPSPSQGEATRG